MSGELGWLTRRQRDGGIDRIPLPGGVRGQLWLCGKHAVGPLGERWARQAATSGARGERRATIPRDGATSPSGDERGDLHADVGGSAPGWTTVVCLTEPHELLDRYPGYAAWLAAAGDRALWWPIPDLHAPALAEMVRFVDALVERLERGDSLLVHCGAGIGRAGTTAVCVLVRLGAPVEEAERVVAAARPMAGPEVGAQRDLCRAFPAR